ncbi:MAG: CDP-glycerol glycerophosphotransferase family protein, partial [Casimicrobiaceae bacterium]
MPAWLAPAYSAAQLARVLAAGRKVLLIHSHIGALTGNALGLALAAQASPDFLPVALFKRRWPRPFGIPAWRRDSPFVPLLLKRADVLAYTGSWPPEFTAASPRSLRLFLWHGMPIKAIGKFDPLAAYRGGEPIDLAIATSERTAEMMSQSYDIAPGKFLISGEPKTDEMPTDRPGWDWSASLKAQHRTVIGYFPTWREKILPIKGRLRRRGDDAVVRQLVTQLTGDEALRHLLERHRAAFVIRVHPVHAGTAPPLPPFFFMRGDQGDATHLLQECDLVVGDYSSVVIDALLFDRPLALWCEDFEHYATQRPMPYFDFRDTFGWAFKSTLSELRDWLGARLASQPLSA